MSFYRINKGAPTETWINLDFVALAKYTTGPPPKLLLTVDAPLAPVITVDSKSEIDEIAKALGVGPV
jgi:hypothetical protein